MNNSNDVKTNDSSKADEVGPNGYRVGYMENGDKVEWLPDDENPGEEYPMILLRNDNDINEARQECWEKVWWNRNVAQSRRIASARGSLSESQLDALYKGTPALERIVNKYGLENLNFTDFEWGLLCGRMSALRWVRGAEWDESLDT